MKKKKNYSNTTNKIKTQEEHTKNIKKKINNYVKAV